MPAQSTVRELIEHNAALRPQAIYALTTEGSRQLSYAQLLSTCRNVVGLLDSFEVRPGDTISLVMPNGLQTVTLLLGAMYGGRCVNPVNLLSQPEQMRYVLSHSDCKLVLVAPDWEARVRQLVAGLERSIERERRAQIRIHRSPPNRWDC